MKFVFLGFYLNVLDIMTQHSAEKEIQVELF